MFNQLLLTNFKQQKDLDTTTELSLGIACLQQLCICIFFFFLIKRKQKPDLEVFREFEMLRDSKIGTSITRYLYAYTNK